MLDPFDDLEFYPGVSITLKCVELGILLPLKSNQFITLACTINALIGSNILKES